MRFCADGPSIPGALLQARDQGRVVFFCGAGVSQAKAGLPGFFDLTKTVIEKLGVLQGSRVDRLIKTIEKDKKENEESFISFDYIFDALGSEFLSRDIEKAVAQALTQQKKPVDLSAHETLLKLATTGEGQVRLITTNFDRLFSYCRPKLKTFRHPRLPDLSHPPTFDGIVHLHGKINEQGNGAEGDGLILSISEFGYAYLADGWAASFIKQILQGYQVVFIGYSADDPPISYLLEGLKKAPPPNPLYAFEAGKEDAVRAKWHQKGVIGIGYDNGNDHKALWDTLDTWVCYADNLDKWLCNTIAQTAKADPKDLQPHERGQVAHIVSTVEGAKKFSTANPTPPASWLYVFDSGFRCKDGTEQTPYRLDSDPIPNSTLLPGNLWNAFAPDTFNAGCRQNKSGPAISGDAEKKRLRALGTWIRKIATQPEARQWASRQHAWSGSTCEEIKQEQKKDDISLNAFWTWYDIIKNQKEDWRQHVVVETLESSSIWPNVEPEQPSYGLLAQEPLATLLQKAQALPTQIWQQGSILRTRYPFAEFSQKRPVRAFAALRRAAKGNEFPQSEWAAFLGANKPKLDKHSQDKDVPEKFIRFIGHQLARYTPDQLAQIIRPATTWLWQWGQALSGNDPDKDTSSGNTPDIVSRLTRKLIEGLSRDINRKPVSILAVNNEKPDWATTAFNAPAGQLAALLFFGLKKTPEGAGSPDKWVQAMDTLLALGGDHKRCAITACTWRLSCCFHIDPEWTKDRLLCLLDSDNEQDKDAFWYGFVYQGCNCQNALFQFLKRPMLDLAQSGRWRSFDEANQIIRHIAHGWRTTDHTCGKRRLSDKELRYALVTSDDNFRCTILLYMHERMVEDEKHSTTFLELMHNVWPQQIEAKSEKVSAALYRMPFTDRDNFPKLAQAVLPFLTAVKPYDWLNFAGHYNQDIAIAADHPHETLALLDAIIAKNASRLPPGVKVTMIDEIGKADETLNNDERFIRLKHIRDSQ